MSSSRDTPSFDLEGQIAVPFSVLFGKEKTREPEQKGTMMQSKQKAIPKVVTGLLVFSFLCVPDTGFAATLHVPGGYGTIQAGIDAAGAGDLVLVAPGTYAETIDFLGKAITVQGETRAAVTAIDGNQSGPVVTFDGGEGEASVIDGFTITNGDSAQGGGIYCNASSPTITNCAISGNNDIGHGEGGGVYCGLESSLMIEDCTISGNHAYDGGGIYIASSSLTITNCTISGNSVLGSGAAGGGVYSEYASLTITNCTISENSTQGFWDYYSGPGGGIYGYESTLTVAGCAVTGNSTSDGVGGGICLSHSLGAIDDCTITGNFAKSGGGGISCASSSPAITHCTISANSLSGDIYSGSNGGGIYCASSHPTIINCTIAENVADAFVGAIGGGIHCEDSDPVIRHCTISGNSLFSTIFDPQGGGIYCGSSSPEITNCVMWGDSAYEGPEIYVASGAPVVTYSDVEGGWPGAGNIAEDPLFVGGGDYHLTSASPCIDAGTDAGIYTDMDGDARPLLSGFDMGADEYDSPCWDGDGDGFYDETCGGDDCDDGDPLVYPGYPESDKMGNCADGKDNDCDGLTDADPECTPPCSTRMTPTSQPPMAFFFIPLLTLLILGRRLFG